MTDGTPLPPPGVPHSTGKVWYGLGALSAGLAVALGAFGAHGLKSVATPDMLALFETAARYQMYHALALLAVGWGSTAWGSRKNRAYLLAGLCFAGGTVLFCGSLYALSTTGILWLGAITPFGGMLFLCGWLSLAVAALRRRD